MLLGWLECVICGRQHSKDFPHGFPNEFKMCCFCQGWAESLIESSKNEVLRLFDFLKSTRFSDMSKKLDKIEKLLTVVGYDER